MQTLLAYKANADATDTRGYTPLMKAAMAKHYDASQALLKAGAQPGLKCREGKVALHWATRGGAQELCNLLIWHQQN